MKTATVFLVAGGVYLSWLVVALFFQRSILFPRDFAPPFSNPGADMPPMERSWLDTEEGKVERWFVPGRGRTENNPGAAVIFAHGNGEVIDDQAALVHGYHSRGVSTLLVEYRGYGRSAGAPSQKKILSDHLRAYDDLKKHPIVDSRKIVFHGRSLGTGVLCALAAKRAPAGLVLHAPFTSVGRFMTNYLIPPFLVLDPFRSDVAIVDYSGVAVVFHGTEDRVVPYSHGEEMARILGAPMIAAPFGHNDFPTEGSVFWEPIEKLLANLSR